MMKRENRAYARLVLLTAFLSAAPAIAFAQEAAPATQYVPPKLLKRGNPSSIPPGNGTVVVKVYVKKDGSFQVQSIIKSSNHELDAAALEIAKNSTYRPATNNHKPIDAFYDFTLKFAGGSASQVQASPELATYEQMVTATTPNFAGAKTGLQTYLEKHPNDPTALTYLGLADYGLKDYDGAIDAFNKAGDKLDSVWKSVAASAYAEDAMQQSQAKNYDKSIALAKQAVDLAPSFGNYNALGLAQFYAGQYNDAIESLKKSQMLAQSGAGATNERRAAIDVNLVAAYLGAGNPDAAKASAAEAIRLNPKSSDQINTAIENYYVSQATAAIQAQKYGDAAAAYEQGAAAVPSAAAALYAQAAIAYLKAPVATQYAKAQADAEKSLAIDPNGELGNYAMGIALAGLGKKTDAIAHLNKAAAAAKTGAGDKTLDAAVQKALDQLNASK